MSEENQKILSVFGRPVLVGILMIGAVVLMTQLWKKKANPTLYVTVSTTPPTPTPTPAPMPLTKTQETEEVWDVVSEVPQNTAWPSVIALETHNPKDPSWINYLTYMDIGSCQGRFIAPIKGSKVKIRFMAQRVMDANVVSATLSNLSSLVVAKPTCHP